MSHELPKDVMVQLRNDLKDRLIREHHQHRMAARLYRNLGRRGMAELEEQEAADKLRMVDALDDPMTDLTHLKESS